MSRLSRRAFAGALAMMGGAAACDDPASPARVTSLEIVRWRAGQFVVLLGGSAFAIP
jgi:hypothetical protein